MSSKEDGSRLLRVALRVNGGFSALSGLIMLVFSSGLARLIGAVAPADLTRIGLSLVLFSGWLFWLSVRAEVPRIQVMVAIFLDAAWVAGSLVVIHTPLPDLTTGGSLVIELVAVVVGLLGAFQAYALRMLQKMSGSVSPSSP